MLVIKRPKACTLLFTTLTTLVRGRGGKTWALFVSACSTMFTSEFFPTALSKIVVTRLRIMLLTNQCNISSKNWLGRQLVGGGGGGGVRVLAM